MTGPAGLQTCRNLLEAGDNGSENDASLCYCELALSSKLVYLDNNISS